MYIKHLTIVMTLLNERKHQEHTHYCQKPQKLERVSYLKKDVEEVIKKSRKDVTIDQVKQTVTVTCTPSHLSHRPTELLFRHLVTVNAMPQPQFRFKRQFGIPYHRHIVTASYSLLLDVTSRLTAFHPVAIHPQMQSRLLPEFDAK